MNSRIIYFFIIMVFFSVNNLFSQPVYGSKVQVEDISIFQDFKKENLFYYSISPLELKVENTGKPFFQLLSMRYIGSSCYGDANEVRYLNMVQFTIVNDVLNKSQLNKIKDVLGGRKVKLKPLPINNISSVILTSTKESKIGNVGYFDSTSGNERGRNSFWSERVFTLKFDNEDAELLWQQVKEGKLALSFNYTVFADMIYGLKNDIKIDTNSDELKEKIDINEDNESKEVFDTTLMNMAVGGNTFALEIDVNKYPESVKKIDIIQEDLPPAYAPIEVSCFDFSNKLRADLEMKYVEIKAEGVSGMPVQIDAYFSNSETDIHTRSIKFPFAVKMDKSVFYRVTEYVNDGTDIKGNWTKKESCAESINITTSPKDNPTETKVVEIEVDEKLFSDSSLIDISISFHYTLGGREKIDRIEFLKEDYSRLKEFVISYSKLSSPKIFVQKNYSDKKTETVEIKDFGFTYYYID